MSVAVDSNIIGHFGPYGGRFVPEALIGALDELALAHELALKDPVFQAELAELHRTYTCLLYTSDAADE